MTGLPLSEKGPDRPVAEDAPRRGFVRRHWRHAAAAAGAAFFVAAAFAVRLAAVGLPASWVDSLSHSFSSDVLSVELADVTFSLPRMRLRVGSMRIYPKGILHAPIAEARDVVFSVRPRLGRPDMRWLRGLSVLDFRFALPDEEVLELFRSAASQEAGESGGRILPEIPKLDFSCERADACGFVLAGVSCVLRVDDGVLRVSDLACGTEAGPRERSGRVNGAFAWDSLHAAFSANAQGSFDPNLLRPLLESAGAPAVAGQIACFSCPDAAPPSFFLEYVYEPSRRRRRLSVDLASPGAFSWNGAELAGGGVRIVAGGEDGWDLLSLRNLRLLRPEGRAEGTVFVDFATQRADVSVASRIDARQLLRVVGILGPRDDLPAVVDNPCTARIAGVVDLGDGPVRENSLGIRVATPGVTVQGVRADNVSALAVLSGADLLVTNLEASVFGGELRAEAAFENLAGGDAPVAVRAALDLEGASHSRLFERFGVDPGPREGVANADLAFDSPLDPLLAGDFGQANASLAFSAEDASVYRFPLFAGLTDMLAALVPGVDFLVEEDALSLEASLSAGRVRVSAFRIEGALFSVSGEGTVALDGPVDARMQVHFLNKGNSFKAVFYYLLSPLSKIFEIRLGGTWSDPEWTSANLPF